jgi:hypothetical protein
MENPTMFLDELPFEVLCEEYALAQRLESELVDVYNLEVDASYDEDWTFADQRVLVAIEDEYLRVHRRVIELAWYLYW